MNLTYYSFPPFQIKPGCVTVMDTGSPKFYQDVVVGLKNQDDTIHLSDDNFTTIPLKTGAQWYGDPLLTVDLNHLFQHKLQLQLEKVLADEQIVSLSDELRQLLVRVLEGSYLMNVPLELPTAPDLTKLIKFSGIQLASAVQHDPYGIIETLIRVQIELNNQRMIVLTNVSHYLSVNQLQSLARLVATTELPILLIEFSSSRRNEIFQECDYHYIDSDFVLW